MDQYRGAPCPVCGKPLTSDDDIVVCPDCGAPHHRECYLAHGSCAFAEQHASGMIWQRPAGSDASPDVRPQAIPPAQMPGVEAAPPDYRKNFERPSGGYQPAVDAEHREQAKEFGIAPDDELGGVSVKEISQFVGENSMYYLPRFKLIDMQQPFFNINLSAVIFNFLYFFHRKMYKVGAILLLFFLLNMLPRLLLLYYIFPDWMQSFLYGSVPVINSGYDNLLMLAQIFHYVYMALCLVAGVFANKFYYRFVVDRVHEIKKRCQDLPESDYVEALAAGGRTNRIAVIALIAVLFLAFSFYILFLINRYGYTI